MRPEARRGGVGRCLVEEALRIATRAACSALELDVLPSRRGAIALYRVLGFVERAAPSDNPHRLVFMERPV